VVESKETAKEPEAPGKRQAPRPGAAEETEQLVFTLGAGGGEILKVEKIDKSGQRRELNEEEAAALTGGEEVDDLEAGLEEAYGAGILDALGEDDEEGEDEEETALRRLVLARLLGRRMVRRGLRRLILRRALRRQILERRGQRRGATVRAA